MDIGNDGQDYVHKLDEWSDYLSGGEE